RTVVVVFFANSNHYKFPKFNLINLLGALSAAGEVFHTKVGGTVTLQCGLGIKEVPMLKDSSTLEISTVKEEDAGEFTCETVKHTLLVVSVSTTPSGPVQKGSRVDLGCEVKGVEPTPTVQWKRPNGKLQVSSKLESVALSDAGKWMCVFSYGGKEYTDSIQIEVKGMTLASYHRKSYTYGQREKERCAVFLILEPTPSTTTPSDFLTKWWKWITAGVCCLLLVIIVIASIFFKRIKRKKVSKENQLGNLLIEISGLGEEARLAGANKTFVKYVKLMGFSLHF
uniref:Ig-like domain-containing protein n=1 Tax=Echeneis naucrates TaxID=173247 RepID=A0A665VJX7_ECHNA